MEFGLRRVKGMYLGPVVCCCLCLWTSGAPRVPGYEALMHLCGHQTCVKHARNIDTPGILMGCAKWCLRLFKPKFEHGTQRDTYGSAAPRVPGYEALTHLCGGQTCVRYAGDIDTPGILMGYAKWCLQLFKLKFEHGTQRGHIWGHGVISLYFLNSCFRIKTTNEKLVTCASWFVFLE